LSGLSLSLSIAPAPLALPFTSRRSQRLSRRVFQQADKAARYTATIEKPGYETQQIPIVKDKINKWYAGNLLGTTSLALGGLIIDPATGAMYVLKPAAIDVTLERERGGR
jgi:hypothetical protein